MHGHAAAAAAAVIVLLVALSPSATAGGPPALPKVTLISDSVPASIAFDTGAKAILAQGIDLCLEPGEGRQLGGAGPAGGIAPPTALELIPALGTQLGPTVIMAIGYNDISAQYAQYMQTALAELHAAGVQHILWTTLHVSPDHTGYETTNAAIEAAAAHDPSVTVLDWNAYASPHPEWFQGDGVHLAGDGPRALATFFHQGLVRLGIATTAFSSVRRRT